MNDCVSEEEMGIGLTAVVKSCQMMTSNCLAISHEK